MGYENKVNHVSSGGGACINLLAGKKLDAVEALIDNKKRFDKKLNDKMGTSAVLLNNEKGANLFKSIKKISIVKVPIPF